MNSLGKFFWGSLLLMVGIIWLAMAMGWLDSLEFLKHWWPMFIIIPCVFRMLMARDRWLSVMGIIVGLIWQLHYWFPDMIDLRMARMSTPPVLIIFAALHILLGRKGPRPHSRR